MAEEKKKKNQLNITYIIISIIIGGAILGFGALNYISSEKNREMEQKKLQQAQEQEQSKTQSNKEALSTCLQKAQDDFQRHFELNTSPAPQPNYPDARKWNNSEIQQTTLKKLQDDKDLCAKLYGAQ